LRVWATVTCVLILSGLAAARPSGPASLPEGLPRQPRFVFVSLHEEISLGTAALVHRAARGLEGGDVLVLDIRTFGGRLDAAVAIRDVLLQLKQRGRKCVGFVNPRAISAGALIAYATDVIVVSSGATMGAATPVQFDGRGDARPAGEKVISYMREEMRATAEARHRSGDIAEAMVDPDVVVKGLSPRGKLLTLDTRTALEWGVASFEAQDRAGLIRGLGYKQGPRRIAEVRWSWAERLGAWISSPLVSSLLMSLGMLALFLGLYSGGSPVPLALGGAFLALYFFGHHLTHLAGLEDILLFVVGLGLVLVEVFHPGLIVPAVLGGLCIIGSLLLGLVDLSRVPLGVQWQSGRILSALATLCGAFLMTLVLGALAVRMLPGSRLGRSLTLTTVLQGSAGGRERSRMEAVVGAVGRALGDLRPSGRITVDGQRFEARVEHGFVERGARVRVLGRRGFELVVAKAREEEPT